MFLVPHPTGANAHIVVQVFSCHPSSSKFLQHNYTKIQRAN